MIELVKNIKAVFALTVGDIAIVVALLLLIVIGSIVWWRRVRERVGKFFKPIAERIRAEVRWRRWQWERIRYPAKGNKFVRRPTNAGMPQTMQHHYTDSDYQAHEFNAPQLSEREKLARDIEKRNERKPKRKKRGETPPVGENDIPVDTGNYDIQANEEFDFNAAFNLEPSTENSNPQGQ